MIRKGTVYIKEEVAGLVWEDENGFSFQYATTYLENPVHGEISRTLPLKREAYSDRSILPFFDGLIPEGWLLDIAIKNWKLKQNDRIGLLLTVCRDCIGAISVINVEDED